MLNEILVGFKSSNFFNLFIENDNKNKLINFSLKNVNIPFGIEEYKNKYIINFEINENSSCNEFEKVIRKIEKNIGNLIEDDDISVKSIFYKKENFPLICRAYVKKNKNKFITVYTNNEKEISLFDLEKNKTYNLDLEISGIWKYKNMSGLYVNVNHIRK